MQLYSCTELHGLRTYLTAYYLSIFINEPIGDWEYELFHIYEGRTESHEQLFFACEMGRADEGECGGRWNQLLCYP